MKYLKYMSFCGIILLTSCTYSINMIHSEGSTDSLSESQAADPNINPNIDLGKI